MEHSEQLHELAQALAKAQAVMGGAKKDSANPFFKSKYADLESVWEACREPLTSNGLSVVQTTDLAERGVTVVTTLLHTSGQWMRGRLHMTPTKDDPQGVGSCLTYARRYALAALAGICPVDDDGEAASGRGDSKGTSALEPPKRKSDAARPPEALSLTGSDDPLLTDAQRRKLFALVGESGVSTDDLRAFVSERWQIKSRTEIRQSMLDALVTWLKINKQQKAEVA